MITKEGKVVKTILRGLTVKEVSGVDSPAQKPALAAILKRDDGSADDLQKLEISMALTTMTGGHSHLITCGGGDYKRRAGNTDYTDGHTHPWLMDEAGNITIGHAQGHNHGVEVVSKGETTVGALKRMLSKEEPPAASPDDSKTAGNKAADPIGKSDKDQKMTQPNNQAADVAAAEKKHKEEMDALTKRAERAERIASLSDTHRTFYKSLKGADADAFLAAGDPERDEQIRKAQDANQVVYKAEDGTVFRKNDDPRLVEMAKGLDMERKKRKEMEEKATKADLEKRASELGHIPGTLEDRVALLKGIDSLPEAEREKALKALKAQNASLAPAFQRAGTSISPSADGGTDDLDKMAQEIAKRDNITFEQAYSKALSTPEGQRLYGQHVEKRHGIAAAV